MKGSERIDDSFKEFEIVDKINLFLKINNVQNQFNRNDLIKFKKILCISDLNLLQKVLDKKQKEKRVNFAIRAKKKLKIRYDLNNNKYFLLFVYYNIYKFNKVLDFIKLFYVNNLISFQNIFLFFDFFLEINEENKSNSNLYCINLISIITNLKVIIKITKTDVVNNQNIINMNIHRLFEKIFSKINIQSIQNIIICKNLIQYPKILSLLKLCYYNNNILDDDNKQFIINNLTNLYSNNLSFEHLTHLYNISKKYLRTNFNKKIESGENNYFTFYNGILDFFEKIMDNKNPYSLNKYFIFNSSLENKGILITSPINLKEGNNCAELNLSFIFSFRQIKSDENNNLINNEKVILSLNNYINKKVILRFKIKQNNFYLNIFKNKKENNHLLFENIKNNIDYLCFSYYDEKNKLFHFYSNEKNNINLNIKLTIEDVSQIYFELGNSFYDNIIRKFNGLIGPVLVFNSKLQNPLDIYQKLSKITKYYLLAEIANNEKNKKENIYFSYYKYYGLLESTNINSKELIKIINDLQNDLNNLIFYINPEVISNNLNFHIGNRFRDYQLYNNQNLNRYYEIQDEKIINDIILIQNSPIEFFVNNNIFDYFILNIEFIYNRLLVNNNSFSENEYFLL